MYNRRCLFSLENRRKWDEFWSERQREKGEKERNLVHNQDNPRFPFILIHPVSSFLFCLLSSWFSLVFRLFFDDFSLITLRIWIGFVVYVPMMAEIKRKKSRRTEHFPKYNEASRKTNHRCERKENIINNRREQNR